MPLNSRNTAQIRNRELRVWDLLLKGVEGIEIARREGVDPAVISRIKKRVEQRITAETDGKAQSLKARQIGEIRRARREAWRAGGILQAGGEDDAAVWWGSHGHGGSQRGEGAEWQSRLSRQGV